ncbi:hypothetical protein LCGC14_2457620, partial [marine sediment metagenome]
MALEDFNTYTEVDPNSRITVATRRVTWTALTENEDAYVYKDKGVNFFDGDFVHLFTVRTSAVSATTRNGYWALTNTLDDLVGTDTADGSYLALRFEFTDPLLSLRLNEVDSGDFRESSNITISLNTTYYLKVYRDESVGSFGTLYLAIYTDAARTTLLSSVVSLALNTSKKDFRYIHAVITYNNGANDFATGFSENMELFSSLTTALKVRTEPSTAITTTSATGNGVIADLGLS